MGGVHLRVMWKMLSGGRSDFALHRPTKVEWEQHVRSGILTIYAVGFELLLACASL